MKIFFLQFVLLLVFNTLPSIALCADKKELIEQLENGIINWSQGIIQAKGLGAPAEKYFGTAKARPMALRAARRVALLNLTETIKGIRVDSSRKAMTFPRARIDQPLYTPIVKTVDREYFDDDTVEVTMQISFTDGLTELLLPKVIKPMEPALPVPAAARKATAITPPEQKPIVYTGLVVDARGIDLKPAMPPRIIDEDGQEIFGIKFVNRESAVQQRMVGYTRDLNAAQDNSRVANNPLTVKGLRAKGTERIDIVISNDDASHVRNTPKSLSFLKKCRVMIVVD